MTNSTKEIIIQKEIIRDISNKLKSIEILVDKNLHNTQKIIHSIEPSRK